MRTLIVLSVLMVGSVAWGEETFYSFNPPDMIVIPSTCPHTNLDYQYIPDPGVEISTVPLKRLSVEWECYKSTSVSNTPECSKAWEYFWERKRKLTEHCRPHEICEVNAIYIQPPKCVNSISTHCIKWLGFREDGMVIWK